MTCPDCGREASSTVGCMTCITEDKKIILLDPNGKVRVHVIDDKVDLSPGGRTKVEWL